MRIPDALVAKDTVTYAVKNTASPTSTVLTDKIGVDAGGSIVEGLANEQLHLLTEGSIAIVDKNGTLINNSSNLTENFSIYVGTKYGTEKLGPINVKNATYHKTASTAPRKQVSIFGDDSSNDGTAISMDVGGSIIEGEDVGFTIRTNKTESVSTSALRKVSTTTKSNDTLSNIIDRLVSKLNVECGDVLTASLSGGAAGIKFEGNTYYNVFNIVPFGFIEGSLAEGAGMSQDSDAALINGVYYSKPSTHADFVNDNIDAVHAVQPIGSGRHMDEALKAGDVNRGGNATYVKYSIPMFKGQITPEDGVTYEQLIVQWSNPIETRGLPATADSFVQTSIIFIPEDDTNSLLTTVNDVLGAIA